MTTPHALEALAGAIEVVSEAVAGASHARADLPTPCPAWDLATLVRHVADSAGTLEQILSAAPPGPPPPPGCAAAQATFRALADAAAAAPHEEPEVALTALAGSFELAIHAWDIAEATRRGPSLPARVVEPLLTYAPVVLGDLERVGLFAPACDPAGARSDLDRLLAMFGRSRGWRHR